MEETASIRSLGRRRGWLGWARWRRIAFNIVVVPGKVAFQAILDVRGRFEFVILAGVNNKFRRTPQTLQRLVHLLTAQNRNVPVVLSPHKQRWRHDVTHSIEGRNL